MAVMSRWLPYTHSDQTIHQNLMGYTSHNSYVHIHTHILSSAVWPLQVSYVNILLTGLYKS